MPQVQSPRVQPDQAVPLHSPTLSRGFQTALFFLFILVTAVAVFIPLDPRMPATGLDYSWHFAMNQAVAQHLHFGTEIMFTYGPYGAVCDHSYHPATDFRMLGGSILLCVSYMTALLSLVSGRKRLLVAALLLIFTMFNGPDSEPLLFTFPFLLVLCVISQTQLNGAGYSSARIVGRNLALTVMLSTLGLLPLVKGSLLVPSAFSTLAVTVFYVVRRNFGHALLALLTPVVSLMTLWILAGQPLANLRPFLHLSILLTSGYTEAMAMSWGVFPAAIGHGFELTCLAISTLICWSILRAPRFESVQRWTLAIFTAGYLLINFKLGFVRAPHLLTAYISLCVFIMILCLLYVDKYLVWSLAIAGVFLLGISMCEDDITLTKHAIAEFKTGIDSDGQGRSRVLYLLTRTAASEFARTTFERTGNTYYEAWYGLRARLQDKALVHRYELATDRIRRENPLPSLPGQTDIYSYDQSVLIASGNHWDPRPILQSYSSYTPLLPEINALHLRGANAPDWILFNLETVDGRLPSLDDGMSWPAMFDGYNFVSFDGRYVLLHRMPATRPTSNYNEVTERNCKLGDTISLPPTAEPVFAQIQLNPTPLGKLLIVLFKPPLLRMDLTLEGGKTEKYRVISNMMTTGFFLSPLVRNTGDFAVLASGNSGSHNGNKVESFSITPSYGGTLFWSGTYTLKLKNFHY